MTLGHKPCFWQIDAPASSNAFARVVRPTHYASIQCSEPGHPMWRGRRLTPLTVVVGARALRDFVFTWTHQVLITDRTLQLLQRHQVSGFAIGPVHARPRAKGGALPKLHELIVTGWAGLAAPESGLRLKENCSKCRWQLYELSQTDRLINPATWDGSDFFIVWPLPHLRFVSERLADILQRAHVSGYELTPAEELHFKVYGLTPGSLSWHMPEERARALGEPLGIYW